MLTDLAQLLTGAVEDRTVVPILADCLEELGLGEVAQLLRRDRNSAETLIGPQNFTYCFPTADVVLTFARGFRHSSPKWTPCAFVELFHGPEPVHLSHSVETTESEGVKVLGVIDRFQSAGKT